MIDFNFSNFLIILELIIIEGLLSFDNALALAAIVQSRLKDPIQQKKALFYGILSSYVFRIVLIFAGVWLMQYEWIKAVSGIYLVFLAIYEIFLHKVSQPSLNEAGGVISTLPRNGAASDEQRSLEKPEKFSGGSRVFIFTVLQIELLDLMFSIDSIAVTLALSNVKWVLITGAVIGILLMRIASNLFIQLIKLFPLLQKTAFVLVGLAGISIILKLKNLNLGFTVLTIDKPIPENIFFALVIIILALGILLSKFVTKKELL